MKGGFASQILTILAEPGTSSQLPLWVGTIKYSNIFSQSLNQIYQKKNPDCSGDPKLCFLHRTGTCTRVKYDSLCPHHPPPLPPPVRCLSPPSYPPAPALWKATQTHPARNNRCGGG
ncbi:unnamed protein product [Tuber melanosporum]|uniref:(Perigord truffle) hypothetical protein n=1 Tax=Tuber melanosporum (strain Mel28) TaxID=656061 RepID=D5G4R9_TUBMM|nr:uncharacterized protein GSTUM_00000069001 [Tuber melanosporum]CAZ79505.1 unnamed protein product [Tuber melanosporum]